MQKKQNKTKQNKTNKQKTTNNKKTKQNKKQTVKKKDITPVNEDVLIPNFTPKYVWAQTFKPAVTKLPLFFLKNWHLQIPQIKKTTPFSSFFKPLNTFYVSYWKRPPFTCFTYVYTYISECPPPGGNLWCENHFPEIIKIGLL